MGPFLIPYEIDGSRILYTAYLPGGKEITGVVNLGQPIDMDTGLPRIEEEHEPDTEMN